jgi:hypothetical protein
MSHRLSILGYWSWPTAPADRSRGWPDPQDLKGEWSAEDRRAALDHLRRGTVFRVFIGRSPCRICGKDLGSRELTDGVWAWPEGLDHYVEAHEVRLPDAFVAASRSFDGSLPSWVLSLKPESWMQTGPDSMTPIAPTVEPTWIVDDGEWLDWAAARTPARPAADAASLDEARAVCRRVSHPTWSAQIEEVMGRWRLRIDASAGATRLYLQECPAAILERRLLSRREPDAGAILDSQRANSIAAEYDGPWGGARALAAHSQAWFVWVKPPIGDWPTADRIDEILRTKHDRFGWTIYHPGGAKSFLTPPADEPSWRWLLARQREQAEQSLAPASGGLPAEQPPTSGHAALGMNDRIVVVTADRHGVIRRVQAADVENPPGIIARCWSAIRRALR